MDFYLETGSPAAVTFVLDCLHNLRGHAREREKERWLEKEQREALPRNTSDESRGREYL